VPDFIRSPSPNFNERDPNVPLRYVVLHYTGMKTAAEARQRLCDPQAAVSAHYLIEEDGTISLLVEEDQRAWHAGESYWRGITDMNSASIGIELVNPGHQFGYHPFAATQINRLKPLLHQIIDRHHMDAPTCLLAHADIAPRRKEDPGELFPWRELALDGLGSWPMPQSVDYGPAEDSEIHVLLRNIGYDCPESEGYDRATRAALLAFQRHYQPDNLTGTPEKETIARLRALSRDSHARN
jgi:N-acetylmuramoyl-L-alanine amidase